jgi:hypothetical protein
MWFIVIRKQNQYNDRICETAKLELKSIIISEGGHGSYNWIEVNNSNRSINLNFKRTKNRKGFPDNYCYEIGDSIIKTANSKLFTIKNGNNWVVFELNCE